MNIGLVARWTGLVAVLGGAALVGGLNLDGEANAGGGGCHGSPEREGDGTRVEMTLNCFSPVVLNVEPGEVITFENMDEAQHDIAGAGAAWGSGGKLMSRGGTATVTFTEPGLYPYSCYLHYGMTGVISVGDERSLAGRAPSAMVVSRFPASPPDDATKMNALSAKENEGSSNAMVLAGGGLLVGAVVVSGAWVMRSRR